MPVNMTATEIIKYYSKKLVTIIKDELEYERAKLTDELHVRTLERIFIEERIYKKIEEQKTAEDVVKAIRKGFVPFKEELIRELSEDDINHLLQIPIRRISLFDINKNKEQVAQINLQLKTIAKKLKNLTACAVEYLTSMIEKFGKNGACDRQTEITTFNAVEVKKIVKRDIPLRYDDKGYIGTSVAGGRELIKVTPFDRILVMRKSGIYTVCDVPEKLFVDSGIWYCNYADKEIINKELFTIIYRDPKTKYCYIKKCRIIAWIMNRHYSIAPEGMEVLHIDTREKFKFKLNFVKKARIKISNQEYNSTSYEEKGLKANGVRIESREVESIEVEEVLENGQGILL
jgi:topoisomerase-4 subunit A